MLSRRKVLIAPVALAAGFRARAADPRPNVLLMLAEKWRAQAVPWASDAEVDPKMDVPNLARFGKESVVFQRAYSACPQGMLGREALLQGRFPHTQDPSPPLGRLLQGAGYEVAEFGNGDRDQIVPFLYSRREKPFFLQWNLRASGAGSELLERREAKNVRENVPSTAASDTEKQLAAFYARCASRDHDIGYVLAALDRPVLVENTIVIFASDHGEQFGSHGINGDDVPFEESGRMALAIRYPRMLHAQSNDMLFSAVDLAPTTLKLCGATPLAGAQGVMQGRDLSNLLNGRLEGRPESVYGEGRLGHGDEWRMLVAGFDKLVTDAEGAPAHLFNLADDPYEMTDLVHHTAHRLKIDELLALEKIWMRKLSDRIDQSGLKLRP